MRFRAKLLTFLIFSCILTYGEIDEAAANQPSVEVNYQVLQRLKASLESTTVENIAIEKKPELPKLKELQPKENNIANKKEATKPANNALKTKENLKENLQKIKSKKLENNVQKDKDKVEPLKIAKPEKNTAKEYNNQPKKDFQKTPDKNKKSQEKSIKRSNQTNKPHKQKTADTKKDTGKTDTSKKEPKELKNKQSEGLAAKNAKNNKALPAAEPKQPSSSTANITTTKQKHAEEEGFFTRMLRSITGTGAGSDNKKPIEGRKDKIEKKQEKKIANTQLKTPALPELKEEQKAGSRVIQKKETREIVPKAPPLSILPKSQSSSQSAGVLEKKKQDASNKIAKPESKNTANTQKVKDREAEVTKAKRLSEEKSALKEKPAEIIPDKEVQKLSNDTKLKAAKDTEASAQIANLKPLDITKLPSEKSNTMEKVAMTKGLLTSLTYEASAIELPASAKGDLNKIIKDLQSDFGRKISILSYASTVNNRAGEARRISLKRALAVRKYIIDKGVAHTRMQVRAMGTNTDKLPADRVDIVEK